MTSPASSQPHFVGIHLCGDILRATIVSGDGTLVERREASLDRENLVAQVAQLVSELRNLAPGVISVGVAIPGLVNRFGEEYLTYKRNVPRWIPTFRAWPGETQE